MPDFLSLNETQRLITELVGSQPDGLDHDVLMAAVDEVNGYIVGAAMVELWRSNVAEFGWSHEQGLTMALLP